MDVTTDEGTDIRMDEVWPLGDDVEIKAAVAVGFQLCNVVRDALAGATGTPNGLNFVDDDDGAIGDSVGPCGRVYQFLMVNGQVRDAVAINCNVPASYGRMIRIL